MAIDIICCKCGYYTNRFSAGELFVKDEGPFCKDCYYNRLVELPDELVGLRKRLVAAEASLMQVLEAFDSACDEKYDELCWAAFHPDGDLFQAWEDIRDAQEGGEDEPR